MPLHRVPEGAIPLMTLEETVAELERAGEQVVNIQSYAGEWLVVTTPRPLREMRVSTRSRKASA